MSGAEADVSSDGETSFEDEDVPLPPSPLKEGTDEPFSVILKGGSPWGFNIQRRAESKASVIISNIDDGGRAGDCRQLMVGDYLLQVNEVKCSTLQVAQELIDSAFRTLTLLVWRGAGDSLSPPVRSASFLQKTRELSERARQAAVQDDSVLFSESKSASARMKPRQRRIESFHGGRRGSAQSSSFSTPASAATTSTTKQAQHAEPSPTNQPTAVAEGGKPGLKGWATEHDLTSSRKPVIMSGSHVTRNVPLPTAKSTPSLNQDDVVNAVATPCGYSPRSPPVLNMTKSTTDIPEHVNYENVKSPTSPKSPSRYQQKFPNRSVFDFSSSAASRRNAGSPRNSYAGASPRNSYISGSPKSSYASGSPRNSFAGYSSASVPSNKSHSPVSGFAPMSLPGSMLSQTQTDSNRTGANYAQNQKHSGSKQYSSDDTPTHVRDKSYDRRSLPPQALLQYRQEFQRENKQETPKPLTSMPVTREEEELDKEVRDLKTRPPSDLDLRPMYSPPAPPVRDISSLKYVTYGRNHEKYPSWPVTAAQPPQNLGPPIDTHLGDKGSESDSRKSESSDKTDKSPVQATKVEDKRSPNVERRTSEESKQTRNQSDPGFKQRPKKNFYTSRKPKEPSVEKAKPEGERFDEFCRQSKPGYPPPKLDPDGHNYGDEKYSIPSPPERDVPNLDGKSLVEKIAAVISPSSAYAPTYHHAFQYNMAAENSASRTNKSDSATSPMSQTQTTRIPGVYFQQAMNAQNLLRPNVPQTKNMIDSATSPLQSPNEERAKFLRTSSPHARHEAVVSPVKPRSVIVTQRPYYNTSTQTDDSLASQSEQSNNESGNQSGQGLNSLSSVSSSASTLRSDSSSHSSGIGTMTFSDHSSAPMLRKLSEEFYRGKLTGMMPNEKRMSSASTYEELKSPRSDSVFGGMKEAESYSSVVIHAHESSGLFGRDELGSSPNVNSKPELSDNEVENYTEYQHKPRYSMDSAILQKHSGSMNMPPRGLNEARFTSESNLSGGNNSQRPHSQSLMHLNRPSSSLGEATQSRQFSSSTYSSSSSRPQGSMEARSSGSRISSDSSTKGDKLRNGSDSVFYERSSPPPQDTDRNGKANVQTATVGRKESMKMAYGTYDENEHHYATPYGHQRNSSEVLSPSAHDANVSHGRSASCNDYLPMHYSQGSEAHRLDQIQEEGSEIRWQEAVKKSMSLSRINTSNYENISPGLIDGNNRKRSDSGKSESENKKDSSSNLKRFASEQIRPNKPDKKQQRKTDANRSGYSSSSGESTKGSKSDSDNVPKLASQQHLSDSDLKRVQQKALLDFVERKSDKARSSDSSEPQSPEMKDTSPEFPPPPPPENMSPVNLASLPPQPSSPFADITKRYNYTKAQRNESLRRTQSITSTSSRDSMSDYTEMKRSERSYQTEWSRLRSQDGATPRRPLSLGSDISGLDQQQSFSAASTPDGEPIHQRSSSETLPKHILAEQDRREQQAVLPATSPQGNNEGMVTSPIYHNLATGDYPRRPPPPVPGINDEPPPALPPRSYHKFTSSKSESYLLAHVDPAQRDELQETFSNDIVPAGTSRWDSSGTGTLREDAYAQQLRKQARRFSEQHKSISMQVVSTKSTVQVSLSQSYKQEPTPALEAIPVQNPSPTSSTSQTDIKQIVFHHSPPSFRGRISPEPPPLPTPLKNGETEIAVDLNKTADFPPPPVEFMGGGDLDEQNDRCADDSYGSYKTRKGPRELGKYKRATSDTSLLKSQQESFRPSHPELSSRDVVEVTPNKPPRKKLELQGRNSPTQGYRSNSPSIHSAENKSANHKPAPQVATFQAAEMSTVQHAHRSMAKPLPSVSVQKLTSLSNISNPSLSNISNSSGSFVSTVVQRPAMNQQDRMPASDEPRRTVKDRVKSIEVFAQSPLSAKSRRNSQDASSRGSLSPDDAGVNAADSLEQLESSIKSSDSFKDRLRPVVKRLESEQIDQLVPQERVSSTDASDYVMMTPPVVPSRTYRHKSGDQTEPVYRKNSFQNRNTGPRPYENSISANIHNPLNQNNVINYKQVSGVEHKRNSEQSMPEPQVPTRSQKQNWASTNEQNKRDKNSNMPSPDSRLIPNYSDENVQNKENTQIQGVQSGQKRNYESSFSRSRNHSTGSSNNSLGSESHQSDKNVANYPKSYPANTRSEQNKAGNSQGQHMGGTSERTEHRGEHSIEHRYSSPDQRSTGQTRNYTSDPRNRRSDINKVDNHNVHHTNSRSDSNPRINNYHSQSSATIPDETTESKANSTKDQHSPHKEHLVTVCHGRQPSAEELECDIKAKELAKVLKDSDKQLSEVLTSDSKKVRMQYLDGLLPVESDQGEERRPRSGTKTEGSASEKKERVEEEPTSPMPSNYYVSPPKAMIELEIRKFGDQLTQDIGDNDALAQKKEELLQRMIKKVHILRDDKKELVVDIEENEALGKQVISCVEKKCRNHQQKDKYRSYIEDIDKIIRLLLKLSGLLARAENTIQGLTDNTNEKIKKMTFDKRDRLYQQHEDAKELKVDIDRRSGQVEAILQECFSTSELDDYHYYIRMKSKYTIQMQELEDKITLGNEQISALQKSIPSKSKS